MGKKISFLSSFEIFRSVILTLNNTDRKYTLRSLADELEVDSSVVRDTLSVINDNIISNNHPFFEVVDDKGVRIDCDKMQEDTAISIKSRFFLSSGKKSFNSGFMNDSDLMWEFSDKLYKNVNMYHKVFDLVSEWCIGEKVVQCTYASETDVMYYPIGVYMDYMKRIFMVSVSPKRGQPEKAFDSDSLIVFTSIDDMLLMDFTDTGKSWNNDQKTSIKYIIQGIRSWFGSPGKISFKDLRSRALSKVTFKIPHGTTKQKNITMKVENELASLIVKDGKEIEGDDVNITINVFRGVTDEMLINWITGYGSSLLVINEENKKWDGAVPLKDCVMERYGRLLKILE